MAADQTISVAIVGHSYVRRLKVYAAQQNIPNLRLDTDKFFVSIRGKGGLCLRHLRSDANIVHFVNVPDICFLQIGENDIVAESKASKIAQDIFSLANYLHEGVGIQKVIIGQLLRRLPYAACINFNDTVYEVNRALREMTTGLKGIVYWPHRGFWNSLSYLGPDGVHLQCTPSNDQPMRKFLRSIRNAIIITSKEIRPV